MCESISKPWATLNSSLPQKSVPDQPRLVLWGAAGHAMVVADIVQRAGQYCLVGFIDDVSLERDGTHFFGYRVYGGRASLELLLAQGVSDILIAVGSNTPRLSMAEYALERGFRLATAVHPAAVVAPDVKLGAGSVVMAGAVVNPGTLLGSNVIVNTAASVDHECVLADGVHIGPGAHLGGKVKVGRCAWVGIGASVRDRIEIGEESVVGAGAVVIRDIPPRVTAFGVPARSRESGAKTETTKAQ